MAIQTRNSALAIKEETTEATPVKPTASTDYVALQDDFSMTPSFDTLDNAELKASIGQAKSILGLEQPTASTSHYLRHSGVEGDAPNYGKTLMKCAFGIEDDAGVEHNTVAGSTTSVINVDAGEGATYLRGQALLIKDGVNGYRIRAVESIATDALTLGFQVPTAPGVGVDLGEAITYVPANSDHPTLSVWHYVGNSGAIQMTSGCRVTDMSVSVSAGDLINASYSLEGVEYYFNPIEITASSKDIDFNEGGSSLATSVAVKTYKDPHELAAAIQTALNAVATAAITCVYQDADGKFTITSDGATFELEWATGTNTATSIGATLGFDVGSDDTGALTYTSDTAVDLSSPQNPIFDNASPMSAKNQEVMVGDADDYACFDASSISFSLSNTKSDILSICAASGKSGSIINSRSVTVDVSALLNKYDADKFKRFREGANTKFQYSFGNKSGGNWVPGQCGCIFIPTATITSFELADQDGLVAVNMTLQGYVNDSGESEVAISFV